MNLTEEITALARQYLSGVHPGSTEISAICPFHVKADGSRERSPSFRMSKLTGLWFCHSCHERGNLRHFLRAAGVGYTRIEDEFGGILDAAANALPPKLDPLQPKLLSQDPIPEGLLGMFHFVPTSLEQEGFTEETLQRFEVGFDKQHMRITYPLRDISGQLVGISGRTVIDDAMRYKIYDREYASWGLPPRIGDAAAKSAVLWNADRLYPSLKNILCPRVVLVEGFKACMWVDQAGVKETTALIGSYMSDQQMWILESIGARVYIMLDNNSAGQKGRRHIGHRLSKGGLDAYIVEYRPDDEKAQPSDLTYDEIYEALDTAPDYYRWRHTKRP